MYICTRCGSIADKLPTFDELHPIGEGYARETHNSWQCACGGEYDEAKECIICGTVLSAEDTDFFGDGICEHCLKEKAEDFELVRKCSQAGGNKETVSVDSLVLHLLSPEDINSILWSYLDNCCEGENFGGLLRERYRQKAAVWAKEDLWWFGDTLSEVMKNEQNGA